MHNQLKIHSFVSQNFNFFSLFCLLISALLLTACEVDNPEGQTPKVKPQGIVVTASAHTIELQWQGVAGAAEYTVYWSNQQGVSKSSGEPIHTTTPYLLHQGLANGVTYYYVITSHTGEFGESPQSDEVSGTPSAVTPSKPGIVNIQPGDGRNTLSWEAITGATRYTLFWSNSTDVRNSVDVKRIDNAVSPFVHSNLNNGQAYYYVLVPENENGEGEASNEFSATPNIPAPIINANTQVLSGQATLSWFEINEADNYELLWNTTGGVSEGDTVITNVSSPYTHAPIADGTTYFYRVRAVKGGVKSPLSNEIQIQPPATIVLNPAVSAPNVPSNFTLRFGDSQITLNAPVDVDVLGYNIYWNEIGDVSRNDSVVRNVQLPYTFIGLTNTNNYFFKLSAINSGGESELSDEVSGAPQIVVPGVPLGVRTMSGDGWFMVRWINVQGAQYYSVKVTEEGVEPQYFDGQQSPFRLDGVTNGVNYTVEVRAVNVLGEMGDPTDPITLNTSEPPPNAPVDVAVIAGNGTNTIRWTSATPINCSNPEEDEGCTVYYLSHSGVKPSNSIPVPGVPQLIGDNQWQLTHSGLVNGERYYYIVTAENIGGESGASHEVWARPYESAPGAPTGLWGQPGHNQVTINFNPVEEAGVTYNLYWAKRLPDGKRDTTQVIPNILPGFVFTDGVNINGVPYYFRVSAFNNIGESKSTPEISVTPRAFTPFSPPQNIQVQSAPTQLTINWDIQEGATGYIIYWSTEPEINPHTSQQFVVGDAQNVFTHEGLRNGLTYFYKIAAINEGSQGALSELISGVPQADLPGIPEQFTTVAVEGGVRVSWTEVEGVSYKISWQLSIDEIGPLSFHGHASTINGVRSGHTVTGLAGGLFYEFLLVAQNAAGESQSDKVRVFVSPPLAPIAPVITNIIPGDGQLIINWDTQPGVVYTLQWYNDFEDFGEILNARPMYVHSGLSNNTTHYYQLIAIARGISSQPSAEVSATPQPGQQGNVPAQPQGVTVVPGVFQNTVSWQVSEDAESYIVEKSFSADMANAQSISIAAPPFHDIELQSGTAVFYRVTAQNTFGDSIPSQIVSGIPLDNVNQPPVAVNDNYIEGVYRGCTFSVEAPGVLANDSDPNENDTLIAEEIGFTPDLIKIAFVITQQGVFTLNPDGSFTYVHNGMFTGADSVDYQVRDSSGLVSTATVTFMVAEPLVELPPLVLTVDQGQQLSMPNPTLLQQDIDLGCINGLIVDLASFSEPAFGQLGNLDENGAFTYTHNGTEPVGAAQSDTFTYRISYNGTGEDTILVTRTVIININNINLPPVAPDINLTVTSGVSTDIDLINAQSDADLPNDTLTLTFATPNTVGVVSDIDVAQGILRYTAPEIVGTLFDSFSYTLTDEAGSASSGVVNITVVQPQVPLGVWSNPRPQGNDLNKVIHNGSMFIAVGDASTVLTSTDGSTWTRQQIVGNYNFHDVMWAGNSFIAVGEDANGSGNGVILESTNGVGNVWQLRKRVQGRIAKRVIVLDNASTGLFRILILLENFGYMFFDNLDVVLTYLVTPDVGELDDIAWTGASVLGVKDEIIYQSSLGETGLDLNFTVLRQGNLGEVYTDIEVINGRIYAVGNFVAERDVVSNLGWTINTVNAGAARLFGIAGSGDDFAMIGLDNSQSSRIDSWRSQNTVDGVWISAGSGQVFNFNSITHGFNASEDSIYVMVGDGGAISTRMAFNDNVPITNNSLSSTSRYNATAVSAGQLPNVADAVAVGNSIMFSINGGASWSVSEVVQTPQTLWDVEFIADRFVAVGDGGLVMDSIDGITWVQNVPPGESGIATLQSIAWNQNISSPVIVVVGQDETGIGKAFIYTGSALNPVQFNSMAANLYDVIWTGTGFVAVGENGWVLRGSVDGLNWTEEQIAPNSTEKLITVDVFNTGNVNRLVAASATSTFTHNGKGWQKTASHNSLVDIVSTVGGYIALHAGRGTMAFYTTSLDGFEWITREFVNVFDRQLSKMSVNLEFREFISAGDKGAIIRVPFLILPPPTEL